MNENYPNTPSVKKERKNTTKSYIQLMRNIESDLFAALMFRPCAWTLLTLIAYRARRKPGIDPRTGMKIETGEALIGDFKTLSMTRGQYRSALEFLRDTTGLISTRTTNRGTIAKLVDSTIYNINPEVSSQPDNHHGWNHSGEEDATNLHQQSRQSNNHKNNQQKAKAGASNDAGISDLELVSCGNVEDCGSQRDCQPATINSTKKEPPDSQQTASNNNEKNLVKKTLQQTTSAGGGGVEGPLSGNSCSSNFSKKQLTPLEEEYIDLNTRYAEANGQIKHSARQYRGGLIKLAKKGELCMSDYGDLKEWAQKKDRDIAALMAKKAEEEHQKIQEKREEERTSEAIAEYYAEYQKLPPSERAKIERIASERSTPGGPSWRSGIARAMGWRTSPPQAVGGVVGDMLNKISKEKEGEDFHGPSC